MQTFLPYPSFVASAAVLDDRRLGKQRVETYQILRALVFPDYAWKQHPAVRMWRGFVPALVTYGVTCCDEWTARGFADRVRESLLGFVAGQPSEEDELLAGGRMPPWLGLTALHESHRSALVRKDPGHYRGYFPDVPDDLPYLWPSDAFPRWPLRRVDPTPLPPPQALIVCGFEQARAGQLEAAEAVAGGDDVLVCMPSGWGATSTGLLAAFSRPAPTLWVTPHAGPAAEPLPPPQPTARTRPAAADQPPAEPPALTARAPGPEDVLALAAETAAIPEHRFHRPDDLADPQLRRALADEGVGLIVVDGADALPPAHRSAVAALRHVLPAVPLMALSGPAGPRRRARLTDELGMVGPHLAGGGIDRGVELDAQLVTGERTRRDAIAAAIDEAGSHALIVASGPDRVPALLDGLRRRGLAASALVAGQRPRRQAEALAGWRSGRVRALVVDRAVELETGRHAVRLLVHAGPPPDLDGLHADLLRYRAGQATRSLVVATDEEQQALLAADDDDSRTERDRAALGRYLGDAPEQRRCAYLDAWGTPC